MGSHLHLQLDYKPSHCSLLTGFSYGDPLQALVSIAETLQKTTV